MTKITYEDGVIVVSQYGVSTIRFRMCDMTYESRMELLRAVEDMAPVHQAGRVGFLKDQPVEERQRVIEEELGVSFPLGMGDQITEDEAEQIVEAQQQFYRGEYDGSEGIMSERAIVDERDFERVDRGGGKSCDLKDLVVYMREADTIPGGNGVLIYIPYATPGELIDDLRGDGDE